MSGLVLAVLFLAVSFGYSMVGLGGGSAYTALMTLAGLDYADIPTISLTLNLIVTTMGCYAYIWAGHARWRLIAPFLFTSAPGAYLGGSLAVPPALFEGLLLAALLFGALRIYRRQGAAVNITFSSGQQLMVSLAAGLLLGLLAGIVGIGGGVFLVPLILVLNLGSAKEAAACGAVFVWVNSLAGLAARLQHGLPESQQLLPLAAAVLVGGACGSYLGSTRLRSKTVERVLGVIVLAAAAVLAKRLLGI